MTCNHKHEYTNKSQALRRLRKKDMRVKQYDIEFCTECDKHVLVKTVDTKKKRNRFEYK